MYRSFLGGFKLTLREITNLTPKLLNNNTTEKKATRKKKNVHYARTQGAGELNMSGLLVQ